MQPIIIHTKPQSSVPASEEQKSCNKAPEITPASTFPKMMGKFAMAIYAASFPFGAICMVYSQSLG